LLFFIQMLVWTFREWWRTPISRRRNDIDKATDVRINRETVNDAAKLMMHRLIARELGRAPSLLDRARISQAKMALRFADRPFVTLRTDEDNPASVICCAISWNCDGAISAW
jgi:hypothetical protein